MTTASGLVERYLSLGLALGRHIDGFVDAYYGPARLVERAGAEAPLAPDRLVADARSLLASLDAGEPLGDPESGDLASEGSSVEAAARRRFLRAQVLGLLTSGRILAGEHLGYAEEVEACYGVRPQRVPEERFASARRNLEQVVPGNDPIAERLIAWREAQAVPPEKLTSAIASLAEDLRERTSRLFGLPEGEHVDFELVTGQPWSGFNYYLGGLASRVAINVDLPVLSTSLAHLVAHEAYPGHHTEHTRKEVGLVRSRRWWEESIFLVGTPQCLIAEGLADLGLEVVVGRRPEAMVAEHLRPLGIAYDPDTVAVVAEASEALAGVRANAAFRLHEDGADPETVIDEVARFGLLPRERAAKTVSFLMDPTWRSYISCYVEGLPRCRAFVGGSPDRFARLITEQFVPDDLVPA
ncbi:MAG: hypothetical protein JWM85_2335 [Acidimicrobiaceae bacterium]|nr:hypothetical protein [Acidimicrobiaceae bacterium]